jgi:inner membrane protein
MFIAHLPAGYLLGRAYGRHSGAVLPGIVLAGMAGGLFPDLDLVYGALVDAGSVHHHRYWTHLPLFWLAVSAAAPALFRGHAGHAVAAFLLGIWSHLLLDGIAGDIWWLWPWRDTPFSLVTIPATHPRWWLNYLLHGTFALELAIVAAAVWREGRAPVFCRRAGAAP